MSIPSPSLSAEANINPRGTTFGVTKEQRNLFLFAGIDGNNKVFTCFHCYMPSKKARAFNWALHSALAQLLTGNKFKLN